MGVFAQTGICDGVGKPFAESTGAAPSPSLGPKDIWLCGKYLLTFTVLENLTILTYLKMIVINSLLVSMKNS